MQLKKTAKNSGKRNYFYVSKLKFEGSPTTLQIAVQYVIGACCLLLSSQTDAVNNTYAL
jgi:hypothetical protein